MLAKTVYACRTAHRRLCRFLATALVFEGLASFFLSAFPSAANAAPTALPADTTRVRWVNVFIGTGGHGHTFPGPVWPGGMIQPGPDTRIHGWDACSGYHFTDSLLNGFSHTHLSGTGGTDFGDFLLMPFTGTPDLHYAGEKGQAQHPAYASPFSHAQEEARPGYYAVSLPRYGIRAELTATPRTAVHRYTFPDTARTWGVLLDVDYNIQEQTNLALEVEQTDAYTLRAFKRTAWWAYRQDIYFEAQFSRPIRSLRIVRDTVAEFDHTEPRCKAVVLFEAQPGTPLLVKAAVSSVDADGARLNLIAEQSGWDFEGTAAQAQAAWEEWLRRADIDTDDDDARTIFYTALYHAAISPNLFTDADGRYLGNDLEIHRAAPGDPMLTTLSLWDTFRALHPLFVLLDPERDEACIRALVQKGKDGGLVPKWDCAGNYTGCMIGYHLASLAADARAKGLRGFDLEETYRACLRCAEYDTRGIAPAVPRWLYPYIMPPARRYKAQYGYIPCDLEKESVAKGLEYAYDDWCIARLAEAAGDTARQRRYEKYARLWRSYFDPATGYMRGKDSQGRWRTPFDPYRSDHRTDDYCEGNAWQWSWFVPHDIEGLVQAHGGPRGFGLRLDSLFEAPSRLTGTDVSADISGLIGQYAHGNEPSHHIAYLYAHSDRPWRTQERVDSILRTLYRNAPDGLCGNEDCGQMSAWYIFSSLGFYPVCPGRPLYTIGRPLFRRATLRLPGGRAFTISAPANSPRRRYVRSLRLNGVPLEGHTISHDQIMAGGTLEMEMADTPAR